MTADPAADLIRMLRNLAADAPYRGARNGQQIAVVGASHRLVQLCPDEKTALILAWQLNLMIGAIELPVLGPHAPVTYPARVLAACALYTPPPGELH